MSDLFNPGAGGWPAGHRAALCVVTLLDLPTPGATQAEGIGKDYGPTGLHRLLNLFADADVTATIGISPAALELAPTLVRQAASSGFEVAGWISEDDDRGVVDSTLARIGGIEPQGVILGLPAAPYGGRVPETGWTITGAGGDLPQASGSGWLIPSSPYWVDRAWLDPEHPSPPSSLLEAWSLSLAAVRSNGGLMTIVLHAEISGRPGIAGQILRFLDEVIESGDVWIGHAGQVASWWTRQSE